MKNVCCRKWCKFTLQPLLGVKKAGNSSVPYAITVTPCVSCMRNSHFKSLLLEESRERERFHGAYKILKRSWDVKYGFHARAHNGNSCSPQFSQIRGHIHSCTTTRTTLTPEDSLLKLEMGFRLPQDTNSAKFDHYDRTYE